MRTDTEKRADELMDEAVPPPFDLSDTARRQLRPLIVRLIEEKGDTRHDLRRGV